MEVQFYAFLTSAFEKMSGQLYAPVALLSGRKAPGTHQTGGWLGVGGSLGLSGRFGKTKFLVLAGYRITIPRSPSPQPIRNRKWAIPAQTSRRNTFFFGVCAVTLSLFLTSNLQKRLAFSYKTQDQHYATSGHPMFVIPCTIQATRRQWNLTLQRNRSNSTKSPVSSAGNVTELRLMSCASKSVRFCKQGGKAASIRLHR